MYSTLNSYVYIHWILDFKYKLLLLSDVTARATASFVPINMKNILLSCGTFYYHVEHLIIMWNIVLSRGTLYYPVEHLLY